MSAPASKIRKILEPAENEAEQEDVDGTDIPDEEKTSDEEEYIVESEETETENDADLKEEKRYKNVLLMLFHFKSNLHRKNVRDSKELKNQCSQFAQIFSMQVMLLYFPSFSKVFPFLS